MKLLGIALRKPTFNEITASAVMAAGLWMACIGLLRASGHMLDRADAGAALIVVAWGCVGARLGIHVGDGWKPMALNVAVGALLVGAYHVACTLFG